MADSNINIKISAKDEASKTLAGISQQLSGFGGAIKTVMGVAGVAIGISALVSGFKDVAKAGMEAERQMQLVTANLKSVGMDTAQVNEKIKSFSESMVQLGRDDEETALTLSKFIKVTKDTEKSMQLTKLASDLAASGFGSMEENASNLEKILAGRGSKALLQYNIKIKEGATLQEQLNAVAGKVTRTLGSFADLNTAEKLQVINIKVSNLKEALFNKFAPTLNMVLDVVVKVFDKMGNYVEGFSDIWSSVWNFIKTLLPPVLNAIQNVIISFINTATIFWNKYGNAIIEIIKAAWKIIGGVVTTALNNVASILNIAGALMSGNWDKIWVEFKNIVKRSWNTIIDVVTSGATIGAKALNSFFGWINEKAGKELFKITPPNFNFVEKLKFKIEETTSSFKVNTNTMKLDAKSMDDAFGKLKLDQNFNKLKVAANEATESQKKAINDLKEKIQELGGAYTDFVSAGKAELLSLSIENKAALKDITDSMDDTKKKLSDLLKEFNKSQADDTKSVAEQVVKTEQEIADLKIEIAKETDDIERDNKTKQLRKLEDAQRNYADFINSISADVVEARRRESLTDLERSIEDFKTKRILAQQEYDDKVAFLNKELSNLQDKFNIEKSLYQAKVDAINVMMKSAEELRRQEIVNTAKLTEDNIKKEMDMYKQLQDAISKTSAAKAASQVTQATQNTPTGSSSTVPAPPPAPAPAPSGGGGGGSTTTIVGGFSMPTTSIQRYAAAGGSDYYRFIGTNNVYETSTGRLISYNEAVQNNIWSKVKDIPRMAEGGIISKPTLVLAGERGKEAIVPLNKMAGAGVGGIIVNINGGNYLSQDAAEKMGDLIIRKLKNTLRI